MPAERSVVIVTYELPETVPGGIGTVAAHKVALFAREGWKVRVVGPADRAVDRHAEPQRPASVRVAADFYRIQPRGNLWKLLQAVVGVFRALRAERPDVIYCLSGTYAGFASYLAGCHFGVPYVVMAHGNEFLRFSQTRLLKGMLRHIYEKALFVSAVSRFTAASLEDLGVARERIFVCHNGVDTGRFHVPPVEVVRAARTKLAGGRSFVLITVSRLDSRKNHLAVLVALEELRARRPEVVGSLRYVICGSGPMEDAIRARAAAAGLEDTIRMAGYVPAAELPAYYAAADAFIMPVIHEREKGSVEGFGLVFLEAAACGTPCIAGRSGGVPDAVVDEETGLLVDGRRPAEVATAIERLVDDAGLRARLARQAGARATAGFEVHALFQRELDYLNRALAVARER